MRKRYIAGLIAIAAIVVVAMLAGCVDEGQVNKAEIKQMIFASVDKIDTYKFDMDMTQEMLIRNETDETKVKTENTGTATMDVTSKKMKMEMTSSMETSANAEMPGRTMDMEMYLVNKTMYMKMDMGIPELPARWTKMEMPGEYAKTWKSQNQVNQQMELLNISEVEVLKEEMMNGVDCYVLKVTPDMEKYGKFLSEQEGMSELMQSLQQNVDIGQLIKQMSMKHWIAKDTKFPIKTEMQMKMEISSDDLILPDAEEKFTMTSDQRTTVDFYDYNKPVTIEVPEEAESAAGYPMMPPMNMTVGNATETPMVPPVNDTEQSPST